MLICKVRTNIVPSSGDGSSNTPRFLGAELVQVYLKATTSTTIFDFSLIDEDNDVVYEIEGIEGEYNQFGIYVPLHGIYTMQIVDSTVDEAITVKLMVEEE
jgi:hypothetical protein